MAEKKKAIIKRKRDRMRVRLKAVGKMGGRGSQTNTHRHAQKRGRENRLGIRFEVIRQT